VLVGRRRSSALVTSSPALPSSSVVTPTCSSLPKVLIARFSVSQVISARILSANPNTNQVELTMRSGDINKLLKRTVGLSDFQVGQKVEGRVKSVMDFGLFIEIAGTKISGLCHKSEVRVVLEFLAV
jgi:RecJ-like exonuclease